MSRIPYASTRLAIEQDHRTVMQRARSFRIFEIQCGIAHERVRAEEEGERLTRLAAQCAALEAAIDASDDAEEASLMKFSLDNDDTGGNGDDDASSSAGSFDRDPGKLKQQLLAARATLQARIVTNKRKFGNKNTNSNDQAELKVNN